MELGYDYGDISLFDHQIKHLRVLKKILGRSQAVLDSSSTGTGKTYTALAVAVDLGLCPIVVCPKIVVSAWSRVAKQFGITAYVSNYEQYVRGNSIFYDNNAKQWNIDNSTIVIFDEAHYLKGKSQRTQMAKLVVKTGAKIMFLSATIASKVLDLHFVGTALGIFYSVDRFLKQMGCIKDRYHRFHGSHCHIKIGSSCSCKSNLGMKVNNELRKRLYGNKAVASRMDITEVANLPELIFQYEDVELSEKEKKKVIESYRVQINAVNEAKQYLKHMQMSKLLDVSDSGVKEYEAKAQMARGQILASLTYARRVSEYAKLLSMLQFVYSECEAGSCVIVFVAFRESAIWLANSISLTLSCGIIIGARGLADETPLNNNVVSDQDMVIDLCSKDVLRVVVCTYAAGNVGISLHDLNGVYPRVELLCFSEWSAEKLVQALGRVYRVGMRTPPICRFLYIKDSVEERVVGILKSKLLTLKSINNMGDVDIDLEAVVFEKV